MPGITKTGGGWTEREKADLVGRVLSGALSVHEACARHDLSADCLRDWVLVFRRSAVKAFDEHLKHTLVAQGIEVTEIAAPGFTGSLGDMALADLIQTITLARRDSVITISHDGGESRIWCTEGEIVDAESGRLRGEPALHRALALEQGQVTAEFSSAHRARTRTIHGPTPALLLDGARRADECRRLKERLGAVRYELGPGVMAANASFTALERVVLRHFYGASRTVDALAQSEVGDLELLKEIRRLVDKDYLVPQRYPGPSLVPSPSDLPSTPSTPPMVMSFLGPARRRARVSSRARTRVLGSAVAVGALGFAAWLASQKQPGSDDPAWSRPAAYLPRPGVAEAAPAGTPHEWAPSAQAPDHAAGSAPDQTVGLAPDRAAGLAPEVPRTAAEWTAAGTPLPWSGALDVKPVGSICPRELEPSVAPRGGAPEELAPSGVAGDLPAEPVPSAARETSQPSAGVRVRSVIAREVPSASKGQAALVATRGRADLQDRLSAGNATIPRMQIIQERPPRMQIVE